MVDTRNGGQQYLVIQFIYVMITFETNRNFAWMLHNLLIQFQATII